jgi:TatD DNase family protein
LTLQALIDSHAHLDFEQLAGDLPDVLARARGSGVVGIVTVGTDLASSREARALAHRFPDQLAATAGVHPHDASKAEPQHFTGIEALLEDPRVVAVGETGLDYHYNFSPPEVQCAVFRRQLELSGESGLPVVIHIREAFDDGFRLVEEVGLPSGGVLHCFTGGPAECERALALGLHISLAGVVTFPKAVELQQACRLVPEDRLLVETDAPYLAPVPRRGKRNEPAYVVHTAKKVAELRGVAAPALHATTLRNTVRLFELEGVLPAAAAVDRVA